MSRRDRLVDRFGLDADARGRRKAFLGLNERDEAILRALREHLVARSQELIDRFYEHLLRFEETREILRAEPGRLERLREIQERYFIRLFEGDYGEDYFEERLRVGTAHQRVGLDPQWYIGAFALYLQLTLPVLVEIHDGDVPRACDAVRALVKIVFLDLGLAIDTYVGAMTAALEESNRHLERILSSIPSGLLVLDAAGTIRDVNPALLALTGRSREELLGASPTLLFGSRDEDLRAGLRRVEAAGSVSAQRSISTRAGEAVPVALSASAIRDRQQRLLGFVAVISDLRERDRLLAEVEQSRSYLRRVLSSISDGLVIASPEGIIEDVNPKLLEMTGYIRAELVGSHLETLWRESREAIAARLAQTARDGSWYDDRRLYPKSGPPLPVAFSGAVIRGRTGDVLGFVGVVRDMSEHNRLLAELERAKANLEQRVEERTRELRMAQAQVFQSEKLSAVGQLAAGIAHEIGTPLNIISGRAEYLLAELGTSDPRGQNLEVIVAQIDRIAGLIEQLLDFARERTADMGPVRISRALQGLLPLLDARLRKHGITLETAVEHLPEIHGNANRLQQVFLNLIMNAVDAIRSERPRGPGHITIDGEATAGEVLVRVRDDGSGIAPEHLPRIFDPFFTTKPVGQGTGLGLSVTFGLIEEMQGSIRAESTPGSETVFHLRFKRA